MRQDQSGMRLDPQLADQPLEAPSRSLAWRYALTLVTVAALSIGGQIIVHGALHDEQTRAHVLNLAGRQRMLGERLGKAALALHQPTTIATTTTPGSADTKAQRARLADTLAALEAAHAELRAVDGLLTPDQDPSPQLQALASTTTQLLTTQHQAPDTITTLLARQDQWVSTMDAVVARYEQASIAHVTRLRTTELAILALILLTLLVEGLLVLRPALRRLHHAVEAALAGARQRAALLSALPEPVVLLTRDGQLQDALIPPSAVPGALAHLERFLAGPHAPTALRVLRELGDDDRVHALDIGPGPSDRRFELRLSRYHADTVLALMHDVTEQRLLERRMLDEVARAQQQMGSDLHDGVCQQLTGLLLLAQALEAAARRGEPIALADLTQLREHLAAGAVEVRQVSQSLYPVVLSQHGLVDALRQLCDSVRALHRIPCTCSTSLARVSLEGAAIHLYRIAQEAVANAVRHARCTTITVELARTRDELVLTISDDGAGLPASPARRPPGMGLHSMNHRAEAIGAFLSITPRTGGGTVVRCALPEPTPAPDPRPESEPT